MDYRITKRIEKILSNDKISDPQHICEVLKEEIKPLIESYIEPGNQKVGEHCYGKSITDPCLGWEDTEELLYTIAEQC